MKVKCPVRKRCPVEECDQVNHLLCTYYMTLKPYEKKSMIPRLKEKVNQLCPKGWAWLIGDCDIREDDCESCKEDLAR